MAQAESTKAVAGALAGNAAVSILKITVAAVSGSAAMFSEGIHSVVDTGNQALLLYGQRRSRKPADERHPFGYGRELYFWSLIVAVIFFGVGGGVSIFEGVRRLLSPEPLGDPLWSYLVLAGAALFEGSSLVYGLRQFFKAKGGLGPWQAIRHGKDPSLFTVVIEDTLDMAGLALATAAIALSHAYSAPRIDAVGSIVIGLMLAAGAILLAQESRELLVGESVDEDVLSDVTALMKQEPYVAAVERPMTMHLGPEEVLLTTAVVFEEDAGRRQLRVALSSMEERIRERYPQITHVCIGAHGVARSSDEELGGDTVSGGEVSSDPRAAA